MKNPRSPDVIRACVLLLFILPAAQSAVIDACFGMTFVGGTENTSQPGPFEVNLLDITDTGGGDSAYTMTMPAFGGT